jgi:pimeloyl-ACP methyl ester carboxylesterase
MPVVSQARGVGYEVVSVRSPWLSDPTTAMVFVHGLGLTRGVWRPWYRAALDATDTAAALDLPGHGSSRDAWGAVPPTLREYVAGVLAVADQLRAERVHLVGESFGGTICLGVASSAPERVASLTTLCTGFRGDWLHGIAHWETLPLEPGGHERWSEEMLVGRFGDDLEVSVRDWVKACHRDTPPHVVSGLIRCLVETNLTDVLEAIECPTLVISPAQSPFVDTRQAEALRAKIRDAELVFLPDARHGAVVSHYRECSATLQSFILRRAGV